MIRLDGLSKSFNRTKVLDGLTLTVDAGERIALVGSNGAGKTTLIRCLLGEYAYEGQVRVGGSDPRRDRTSVLKMIGFVPQLPPPLKMPVSDLIAFASGVSGADPGHIASVAAELGLDLREVAQRPFVKLSGGQKQKLLIAIALGRESSLLILDEPAANLDPAARNAMFNIMARRRGDTMIVSSHRVDEVAALVTRVVELERGSVSFDDRLTTSGGAAAIMRAYVRVARREDSFAQAMAEWRFVSSEDGLVWSGRIAAPDRLRFMCLLARYAGLLTSASFGAAEEKDCDDEPLCRCA
ncbi:MAG: ABC transporter ATP-binding protein [Rhodomicrobium sp.]